MINSTITLFGSPKQRKTRAGVEFERIEAYQPLAQVVSVLQSAKDSGHSMVQFILRNVKYAKGKNAGQEGIVAEIHTFKGKE